MERDKQVSVNKCPMNCGGNLVKARVSEVALECTRCYFRCHAGHLGRITTALELAKAEVKLNTQQGSYEEESVSLANVRIAHEHVLGGSMGDVKRYELCYDDSDNYWIGESGCGDYVLHSDYTDLKDHNKYLEACLEDRNSEMMKHVKMYEAIEDEILWLLDIDDAWRVSCTRETDDAWVESQTSFTLARAEITKLLGGNNNEPL